MTDLATALRDRYVLERELGRGGTATVFLAHDTKHDRHVALKVLHPNLAATLGPERFQREIRLAARLQHPHILTVLDSGEAAGQLWYTMPYVDGETVRERLRRERQLPIEEAIRITREAALALEYAHQHGVVHRDIKPENLLLTEDGSTLVADFGVARAIAMQETDLTGTGVAIGTPAYMSPEQASGERDVDARSDIYSLGAVLYEMLGGEPPFTGPTAQAVIARRFTETPRPLRALRAGVPLSVELAVARALARTPADRYASAAHLAQALVAATSVESAGSTSRGPARQERIRSSLRTGLAYLVMGVLLGLGVLFAWQRYQQSGEPVTAGTRKTLVVLPFENLGKPQDEYFADGLAAAITTRLGSIPGLGIIARQSATQYKETGKSPRQIGQELGVQYILTGTVRWDGSSGRNSRVRVNPQLIAAEDQRQLWAEQYDTTLASVFEVEASLARQVARALDLALARSDGQPLLDPVPTRNLEAYDLYLRGRQLGQRGYTPETFRQAIALYQRAVALDRGFAAAYAQLSLAHTFMYWLYYDRSAARLELARQAVERAAQLAPNSPETMVALANYHYRSALDYERALKHLDALERIRPSDPDLATIRGIVLRRQSRWEESLDQLKQAARLNPQSAVALTDLADNHLYLRRYHQAIGAYDSALALEPGSSDIAVQRAIAYLSHTGDQAGFQQMMPPLTQRVIVPLGAPTGIIAVAELVPLLSRVQQDQLLEASAEEFVGDTASQILARAMVYRVREWTNPAQRAFALVDTILVRKLADRPDDHIYLAAHGIALAGLDLADSAVAQGKRAMAERSTARDAIEGPLAEAALARIYAMLGRSDAALDQLELILSRPGPLSAAWLRVDPLWEPLRKNPRFARLLQR